MSVITKIFIILHVIVSVVFASALVVFVNKQENFKIAADDAKAALSREIVARRNTEAEVVAVRGEKDRAISTADARVAAYSTRAKELEAQIPPLTAQLAAKDVEIAKAQADTQTTLAALQAQTDALKAKDALVDTLRTQADKVAKDYADVVVALSARTNELDGMTARFRNEKENTAALNDTINQLRQQLTLAQQGAAPGAAGPARPGPAGPGAMVPTGAAAPSIRGVVKDKKMIGGVPYATISIGSADNVIKGMKFKVIDQTRFLGYLTVDSVDPQEAAGHLEGPAVDAIVPGVEVRTQWQ